MKTTIQKAIFWTPRILCIAFILFLALFALDVFEYNRGFWDTALALLMHLIPNFFLTLILILSWKWEWIGGILFNAAGVFYLVAVRHQDIYAYIFISGPAFLIGILFLAGWFAKKRISTEK